MRGRGGTPQGNGIVASPVFRWLVGNTIALYLRLVTATNRIIRVPEERAVREAEFMKLRPAIFVSWHANILSLPLFLEEGMGEFVALSSPHADGQLGAAVVKAYGYRSILGTGTSDRQKDGTGGMAAMRAMLKELAEGRSVYLTAEIPPMPGRRVSPGVIALARISGRPIIAMAAATTRRTIVDRLWDKMQINHPFGTAVLIFDGPLMVDASIGNEAARDRLKALLDNAYAEALRRADEIAARR